MPKLHKPSADTDCTIKIGLDEYSYLIQCHVLLQQILNAESYSHSGYIASAKTILAELEENSADV